VLSWQAMMQAWRIPVWLTAEPAPQTRPALRPVLRRPARAGVY